MLSGLESGLHRSMANTREEVIMCRRTFLQGCKDHRLADIPLSLLVEIRTTCKELSGFVVSAYRYQLFLAMAVRPILILMCRPDASLRLLAGPDPCLGLAQRIMHRFCAFPQITFCQHQEREGWLALTTGPTIVPVLCRIICTSLTGVNLSPPVEEIMSCGRRASSLPLL